MPISRSNATNDYVPLSDCQCFFFFFNIFERRNIINVINVRRNYVKAERIRIKLRLVPPVSLPPSIYEKPASAAGLILFFFTMERSSRASRGINWKLVLSRNRKRKKKRKKNLYVNFHRTPSNIDRTIFHSRLNCGGGKKEKIALKNRFEKEKRRNFAITRSRVEKIKRKIVRNN